MVVHHVHRWGTGVGLAAGSAAVAAVLGMGTAYADDGGAGGVDQINGWTVTPTNDNVEILTNNATLSDPSNALGLGTSPIVGEWVSTPANLLFSTSGSDDQFVTPDAVGTDDNLFIQDSWVAGLEMAAVYTAQPNETLSFLVPTAGGNQVVDLFNLNIGDAPPLFNPDATGPIDVGGVELASPDAGALFNNLFDAVFQGDATAWTNATTLFDDLFGIDPSGAADAVDVTSALPDFGF